MLAWSRLARPTLAGAGFVRAFLVLALLVRLTRALVRAVGRRGAEARPGGPGPEARVAARLLWVARLWVARLWTSPAVGTGLAAAVPPLLVLPRRVVRPARAGPVLPVSAVLAERPPRGSTSARPVE